MHQSPAPIPPESSSKTSFTREEWRGVGGLTGLLMLRMLGFYLVLPILTPYTRELAGSTPLLVGLSVGIYGLTQTLFQIPFGALSDRWGRKPVLTAGLGLFAIGSAVCAVADTALILVAGRLIQGMGAIASVVVAMLADLTRDRVRGRAMALIGISIGASFSIGLLFGPTASAQIGVPNLFWFTAALTLLGIAALWWLIPTPPRVTHHEEAEYSGEHLFEVVTNRHLLRLDLGVFNLHMCLTSIFVTMPFLIEEHVDPAQMWRIFLPLLVVGFVVILSGPRLAERKGGGKMVALGGQGILIGALVVLALSSPASVTQPDIGLKALLAGLGVFIVAFALLEPLLPSLLTRLCQQANRGTAAGIFNMSQFSGAFVGGLISGVFLERDLSGLFWILAGTSFLWFLAAIRLEDPEHMTVMSFSLADTGDDDRKRVVKRLLKIRGVEDVAWEKERGRILVRYAEERVDSAHLRTIVEEMLSSISS